MSWRPFAIHCSLESKPMETVKSRYKAHPWLPIAMSQLSTRFPDPHRLKYSALIVRYAAAPRGPVATQYCYTGFPVLFVSSSQSSQLSGSIPPNRSQDSLIVAGSDVISSPSPTQLPILQRVIKPLSRVSSSTTAKKLRSSQALDGAFLRKSAHSRKVLPMKGDFQSLSIGAFVLSIPPSSVSGGAVSY